MKINRRNNLRRFERVQCKVPICSKVTIVQINNHIVNTGSSQVCVEDIGAGGLRFLSNLKLPANKKVIIKFTTNILDENVVFQGYIVRRVEFERNIFQYGVEFIYEDNELESKEKLIRDLNLRLSKNLNIQSSNFCKRSKMECLRVTSSNGEKRAFFRFQCPNPLCATMKIHKINNKIINSDRDMICIEDIGPGGLRFLSTIDLPVIQDIMYEFEVMILDEKISLKGTITRKKVLETGIYEYGVKYRILEVQKENLIEVIEEMKQRLNKRNGFGNSSFCIKSKIDCLRSRVNS